MSEASSWERDAYGPGYRGGIQHRMGSSARPGGWGEEEQRYGRYGQGIPADTFSATYSEVWAIPGPYTGFGPEGYRRSNERIHEDVCERLTHHGALDARAIRVQVDDDGEVMLEGTVDHRQAKRMAEDIAESAPGVRDVQNRLRIADRTRAGGADSRDEGTASGDRRVEEREIESRSGGDSDVREARRGGAREETKSRPRGRQKQTKDDR